MSIQLTFRAPGIPNFTANLKDEALADLFRLVQEQRDDSAPQGQQPPASIGGDFSSQSVGLPGNSFVSPNSETSVKEWLKSHGAAELLNVFSKWNSFYEKIVLLSAWHEARGGHTPWRSADIDETFKQAKEKAPANFPRDIKTAIQSGMIHAETPRTYTVTRTGWNKIAQAIQTLQ